MVGRAPKTEGEESEERVLHSAKGFMLVEVSMMVILVLFEMRVKDVENDMGLEPRMESSWEKAIA